MIQIDASGFGMGAVLTQNGYPITFFSKNFYPKLQRSSNYVRTLHALTLVIKKGHCYLLARKFIIETD